MKTNSKSETTLVVFDCLDHGGATRMVQEITHNNPKKKYVILAGESSETEDVVNDFKNSKILTFPTFFNNQLLYYFYTVWGTFITSFKVLKKHKIDKIILNVPYSSLGIYLNPFLRRIKKTYILHGGWDLEKYSTLKNTNITIDKPVYKNHLRISKKIKFLIHYYIQKMCMSFSDSVIVYSNYSKNIALKYFKISSAKIHIISPTLNTLNNTKRINKSEINTIKNNLNVQTNEYLFLIASRIEKRKGIDLAIRAVELLKNRNVQKFRLIITGPAGYAEWYVYETLVYCRKQNLFTHVLFLNELDRVNELYKLYQAVDCVIMPSTSLETLGLVTLESLHFGTPVIGFKSGATKEILYKYNRKLLVDKMDAQSLAEKMEWAIKHKGKL